MNLLLRQIWALIRKNLLLICVRKPVVTFIRAIALPLAIVLVVAYSKEFFSTPQHWGVSSPHNIRSLKDGLAATPGRDIVGFIDNGMKGGEVASVIDSLSKQISEAGKSPKTYNSSRALAEECRTDMKGVSPCYGAVVFHSSPSERSNDSSMGFWNYTLRGEGGSPANVLSDMNAPEKNLLPLQRAVDTEIIRVSRMKNTSRLPSESRVILFTDQDQEFLDKSRTSNYLSLAIEAFGPVFAFTLISIVYHITSFVAHERELGMSGLIDTMISGGSSIRGRLVRQIATYISFAMVYFPSWLAVGIVISVVVFPVHSGSLPVGFLILSGMSFTSFSLFGASFFKKAQLSGSIMVVITVVGAILPVVLSTQTKATRAVISIIFPSANLTYFLTSIATFEALDKRVDMKLTHHEQLGRNDYRLPLYAHWVIAVIHILFFSALAFAVEHVLFSTASSHRRFAQPESSGDATVTLSGFSKTYRPSILARVFKRRKDVHAVKGLDLKAYPGQILCLLGPNGCGKSTTLNCISGDQKMSSGDITIDHTGGLGYAPQKNVIWPELTVEEHIRIFSDLKCLSSVNDEVVNVLAKGVDLLKKLRAQAKTLSGGQKRKLQMAMMFAGGSAVCCVDEVSTGLDPISRRRIWEILLVERERRTIIMTTHFLDEADYLADDIAIMYKGTLRASGTAASLKHSYGDGYTVKLPYQTDIDVQVSKPIQKEQSRHQTVYRVGTAALAAELAEKLEWHQLRDYQISGPTMEELFLKVTGDKALLTDRASSEEEDTAIKGHDATVNVTDSDYELTEGQPISVFKQWWILFCKRFRILQRRYIPYLIAIAFAIAGAGVAPLLIKILKEPMACPTLADLIDDSSIRSDFGTGYTQSSSYIDPRVYVFGPASKLNDSTISSRLELMADAYSTNHTLNFSTNFPRGYSNASQIVERLLLVNTYDEFSHAVQNNWKVQAAKSTYKGYSPFTSLRGGIWLGDDNSAPTLLANLRQIKQFSQLTNFLDIMVGGVPISMAYDTFALTAIPDLFNFRALMVIIYFGLIMCCYPVFFALYPTNERISNVRSMQYSNGIRPVPLWLSHLSFDAIFVVVISAAATGLLFASTPIWTGLGFIFIIFVLYGIVAALLSYVISMFAKGAVSAWFLMALGQVVFYFAYFGGILGVHSATTYPDLEPTMNALFFGLGIVSPAVCLERTLFIGLQQMALSCNQRAAGSIYLFGGPIMYLILQGIFLFALLLWWDSGFVIPASRSHKVTKDPEATEMYESDLFSERKRLVSGTTDLRVDSVTKSFGKNLAVDNVTFGVQQSEIFALLGPNGAGKSTIISMIRGDIKPSTSNSTIDIAGYSILKRAVVARANLGVCPQFDSADVLTVKETLRFFAKTRGVKDIDYNVSTVIAACGLEDWTNQLAQKLSGGTKRKLSLAVALVGNPRVLVLDEPSSALDANAKRTLWRCLQTVARGRAVVLTTHSMEEADALADRIGIVSSRMLALGGREDLKRRAGENFYLHVVSGSAPRTTLEELQVMKNWIHETFPDAKISRETQGGQVRFEVPAEGREMVDLIRKLESAKGDLGVEFYSVGKATLDEVFENIVRKYGDDDGIER
ncbi:P-loop containing nucleoside triphosphate hydrolase protein [Cucurbitaria berberidis CBS 394.84]|uniref:P-loop containing nucleoside triphosphate hydrolase protein n=1 Tax=Cucurbitaria berberidis CBS 394.84 TaxID=1168544 RepID=A0A9P4GF31_9PLEO|nr:P-loop containing nucleoside triphosphate hydrolase protein [Cucurbitaria berberidis CBS 394.84]KAF1844873.1 P-loop containing nucleoside triphosphate hydrolase protein [Cucurbitaria berberidis CBS 394.84]